MPEMWEAFRLRDRACEGSNILTATASRRKADWYLHGMFPEEKIVNVSNWLTRADKKEALLHSRRALDSYYSVVVISQVVSQRFAHILDLYAKSPQVFRNSI